MFTSKMDYLREHNVPQIIEHILQRIVQDEPQRPVEYIHELLKAPIPPQIMIAGPPGSGKGTQCQALVKRYGIVHISSGELLRAEVAAGTELGKMAESYIKNGELVPNRLVMGIIRARMEQDDVRERGWLLDGFPRSKEQADLLEAEGIIPHCVLVLEVSDDTVIKRIEHRRTDPATGKVYHLLFNPPPENDAALLDRLVQRADDYRPAVEARLRVYYEKITVLKNYYGPVVETVDGERTIKEVTKDVLATVERHRLK